MGKQTVMEYTLGNSFQKSWIALIEEQMCSTKLEISFHETLLGVYQNKTKISAKRFLFHKVQNTETLSIEIGRAHV